jgi:hypothetical protein
MQVPCRLFLRMTRRGRHIWTETRSGWVAKQGRIRVVKHATAQGEVRYQLRIVRAGRVPHSSFHKTVQLAKMMAEVLW